MSHVLKEYETRYEKITVEEVSEFKFITTFYDKEVSLEEDRDVSVFETYAGALDYAFDLLVKLLREGGTIK